MDSGRSLIAELEGAIQGGSPDKRVETLRRVTDLFLHDAERLNGQQIELFDDVLGRLITTIEGKALAELGQRFGPVKNAPIDVVRRLARDDNIAVAEPILTQSARLSTEDLVEIAKAKSQAHLLAISARKELDTAVTDVLLDRGDHRVIHRIADNSGARFSESGFASLVQRSEKDEQLAEKVGLRNDVPPQLFRQLVERAGETVRARLLAAASPESRHFIQRILATITADLGCEVGANPESDHGEAKRLVAALQSKGKINESIVLEFAKANKFAELTAALSVLCSAPFELVINLLQSTRREAVLIPCKAAGLEWQTVQAILSGRATRCIGCSNDLEIAKIDYSQLTQSSAQRVLRFWQVRQTASSNNPAKA